MAGRIRRRLSALPGLLARAPSPVSIAAGIALILLGALMITRPLTSVFLLGVYVAVSAVISGVAELVGDRPDPTWWRRAFGIAAIVLGVGVLIFLERSLTLLPPILAALLILGGLASLGEALLRGTPSERVLAAAWGSAQVVFGVLALAWPDVTVLVVAVVFAARTIVLGASVVVRTVRDRVAKARDAGDTPRASRRTLRWLAAGRFALSALLLATAAGGWALNDWLSDGAPVIDAFYDPPAQVPYEHGRLIRADDFPGRSPAGGEVTRILYTTRDAVGQPAVASALVIAPTERRPGVRPVVSWNHGTTGVARGCAPSLREDAATRWAIPALEDALARGWVVVSSDYSGQGAPGVFPYLIGRGEARSSLDAILAARELPGLALSSDTVAWGHSQGGHAALWMSQIAADYTPDLDILGTAVLAPAADPYALAREFVSGPPNALLSVLISWVLVPYSDTYDDVDLDRYVAPGGRVIVREMTQRCPSEPGVVVSVATALGVSEDQPLFRRDLTSGPLGERLEANAARGPWDTPVLVAWGSADEVIPPRLQQQFVDDACAQGDRVRWAVYEGYDHLGTLLPRSRFLPLLVSWTDARFTGASLPDDDCARLGG